MKLQKVTEIKDHGLLQGLGDVEDHPDFILKDGTRDFTGDQSMGGFGLTGINYLAFDLLTSEPDWGEGRAYWEDGIFQIDSKIEHLHLNPGYNRVQLVVNKSGSTILKGRAVYTDDVQGGISTIQLADNSSEATSTAVAGITQEDIEDNAQSYIVTDGLLKKQDTSGFASTDSLFLGTNGNIVNTEPVSPAHSVFLGKPGKLNASTGEIYIRVESGLEMDELHDVLISSITDDDILQYDSATSLWKNVPPSTFSDIYALLDGSNQPFTGDLEISKSLPEIRFTDTFDDNYARLIRTSVLNQMSLLNITNKSGGVGYALDFGGDPEYVQVGTTATARSDANWSASMWFKTSTTGVRQGLASKFHGDFNSTWDWIIEVFSDNKIRVFIFNTAGSAHAILSGVGSVVTDGAKHHVMVNWDAGNKLEVFLDNVSIGTDTSFVGTASAGSNAELRFGVADTLGLGFNLVGVLDELHLWNEIRSVNDVDDLWASGNGLYVNKDDDWPTDGGSIGDNLGGSWHFDTGSGLTAFDSSDNSLDGTLVNMEDPGDWITPGLIVVPGTDNEINVISAKNGVDALQGYIITLGDSTHPGEIIYVGDKHTWNIDGNNVMGLDVNGTLSIDTGNDVNALTLIGAATQNDYLLALQDSNLVDTNLFGEAGVKLMDNAGGDVELFGGVDVGDAASSKSFIVHRKAAEGDDSAKIWFDQFQSGYFDYTSDILIRSTTAGKTLKFGFGKDNNFTFGENVGAGINPYIRHYGYITADTANKYIQWQVNDTTDWFELTREDSNILGFDVQMPLFVGGYIGVDELSADPTDPVEGKAVFWMGDGTGSGADGDLLYMEQSGAVVSTGCLKWTDFVPSSITVNASDGTTGSVSDVQDMFDGNFFQIEELAETPGYDVEFIFSNVDKYPTKVVTRWLYSGSATHDVTWDIWNYNSSAWDTLRAFQDSRNYESSMTMYIPQSNESNYVSGGAAKVRVYHRSAGNAAHNNKIYYVGITHALQGVI